VSSNKEGAALVGAGAAACAVCCAGPILGFLAEIWLGTAIGVAVFGSIALVVAVAVAVAILVVRRRRRRRHAGACSPGACSPVEERAVEILQRR
jgi:hypothetical protein